MKLITNSRLAMFRRCQREHHLRYECAWTARRESEPLRFGSMVHAGLEALWRGQPVPPMKGEDEFEGIRAEEMIRAYAIRWADDALKYEPVGVELEFQGPALDGEYTLAGKLDVLVRERATGRLLIVEHKTSSQDIGPGSLYWRRLALDSQVSMYFLGANELGHQPAACLYDVLKKVQARPLKATPPDRRKYRKDGALYANQREVDETVEEYRWRVREELAENIGDYFQRIEIVRLEDSIEAFRHQIAAYHGAIIHSGRMNMPNPDACVRYGTTCEYMGVCEGTENLEDPTRFVRLSWPHPELKRAP